MTVHARESLAKEQFVLFTTFKKSGDEVATPVWIAPVGENQLGFTTSGSTWKVKRLARNAQVRLQPCSRAGTPTAGSTIVDATAEVVSEGPRVHQVRAAIENKYGFQVKLIHAVQSVMAKLNYPKKRSAYTNDVVIVISFDAVGEPGTAS